MRYTPKNQTIAIMQPYFLPYIGYFQLINAVDSFVVYDNIEYTKKSWINRNRFLQNGRDVLFTLPLKGDSDFLNIDERFISTDFNANKFLNSIDNAYKKAPYYKSLMPILESIVVYPRSNLFDFIYHSILQICNYLGIQTNIYISSTIPINHKEKAEQKVISICKKMCANKYINAIGGTALYSNDDFKQEGIALYFLQTSKALHYSQLDNNFVPNLSIIDIIAFNANEKIKTMLNQYTLVGNHADMGGGVEALTFINSTQNLSPNTPLQRSA